MPLTSGNFADLLAPPLVRTFNLAMGRPQPMIDMLFKVESPQPVMRSNTRDLERKAWSHRSMGRFHIPTSMLVTGWISATMSSRKVFRSSAGLWMTSKATKSPDAHRIWRMLFKSHKRLMQPMSSSMDSRTAGPTAWVPVPTAPTAWLS
jgi:hypothetical protein